MECFTDYPQQVEAWLAAAARCCHSGVLGQLNQQLLGRVLAAIRAADVLAASGSVRHGAPLTQQLRPVGAVMKVQN